MWDQSAPERCNERSSQSTGMGAVGCGAVCFSGSIVLDGRKSCGRIAFCSFSYLWPRLCIIRAIGAGFLNARLGVQQFVSCACSEIPSPDVLGASVHIDRRAQLRARRFGLVGPTREAFPPPPVAAERGQRGSVLPIAGFDPCLGQASSLDLRAGPQGPAERRDPLVRLLPPRLPAWLHPDMLTSDLIPRAARSRGNWRAGGCRESRTEGTPKEGI